MKLFKFSLLLFSIILLLTGCTQIENDVPATVVLEASKTSNIKKGEPVIFKFNNIPVESDVSWKIFPDAGVNLMPNGNTASVLFDMAGDYKVTGTYGHAVLETSVNVIDSAYVPVQDNIVPFEPNETLNVSVSIIDSLEVGKPDLLVQLTFTTSNKYDCLNNYLFVKQDYYSDYVIFSFDGVYIPDSRFCSAGEKEAQYSIVLKFDSKSAQRHRIEISFLGKNYKGYYFVQDNLFFIDWPYTEEIIFTNAIIIGENNGEDCSFDIDNPDVDLFVSLLKAGTYNCYEKNEYGENLWLIMPKFNQNHLEPLLEYAKDTTHITKFPANPMSSRPPYPNGRDYFILNECLLWIVEGIRTGQGSEFKFPSLDPYLINNSKPATEREKGLTITEILEVGELYYSWWHNSAIFEWWLRNPPLEGTSYSWF